MKRFRKILRIIVAIAILLGASIGIAWVLVLLKFPLTPCAKPYDNSCLGINYLLLQIMSLCASVITCYFAARFYFNKEKDKHIREIYVKYTIYFGVAVDMCFIVTELVDIVREKNDSNSAAIACLFMIFFIYKQIRPFAEGKVRQYKKDNGIIMDGDYVERPPIRTDT